MSYEFSLVLSRQVTDDESTALLSAGPGGATVTTAPLPTNADVVVTQLDFNTEAPTLVEAITSALEALKAVPDLTAASLSVPAQPNGEAGDQGGEPGEPAVATAAASAGGHGEPAMAPSR